MLKKYLPTGKQFEKLPNNFLVTSIDPGSKNFAIRIEKRSKGKIETLVMELLDIREESMDELIVNLTNLLDSIFWLLCMCRIFVIERQISKLNPNMTIVSQHLFSYFILKLKNSSLDPIIYAIHSQCIKKYFKIPKGLKKKVKEPIKEIAVKILIKGGDTKGKLKYDSMKQEYKEHFGDIIVGIECVCQMEGLPTIL